MIEADLTAKNMALLDIAEYWDGKAETAVEACGHVRLIARKALDRWPPKFMPTSPDARKPEEE